MRHASREPVSWGRRRGRPRSLDEDERSRTHSGNGLPKQAEPGLGLSPGREGAETGGFQEREGDEVSRGSLLCGDCYHFKGRKLSFQVFSDFFFFLIFLFFWVRSAHLRISKPFMLKLFCFLKEIHNFGSQGRTGLGRNAVVYILLYGLIYFFYCANQLEDFFFSGANSDLFILFLLLFPHMYLLSF